MMRTLKSLSIMLMAMTVSTLFISCGEEYESRLHELIVKDVTFTTSAAGSQTQTFRNEDLSNYTATSSAPWCVATFDLVESQLTVTVQENDTYDNREAIITLSDTKATDQIRTFKVSQPQKDAVLVDSTTYEVAGGGGEVKIKVRANTNYEVKADNDWLSVVSTRGLETYTVTIKAENNNSGSTRSGQVRIINTKDNEYTKVTIMQAFVPTYAFPFKTFTIDELGGEIAVRVSANFAIDVFCEEDWVRKNGREEIDETNFMQLLRVAPFSDKLPQRVTKVIFSNINIPMSETVTITQYRTLYISESEVEVMERDTIGVTLHNMNDVAVTWSSSDERVAIVKDGDIIGVKPGTAVITVQSAEGHSDQVNVVVTERPLEVEKVLKASWSMSYVIEDDLSVPVYYCTVINDSDEDIEITDCFLHGVLADNSTWSKADPSAVGILEAHHKVEASVKSYYTLKNLKFEWKYKYEDQEGSFFSEAPDEIPVREVEVVPGEGDEEEGGEVTPPAEARKRLVRHRNR